MSGFYGHRWTSSYGDDPQGIAGDTWSAGLAGLSPLQLARGIRACAKSLDAWPPSMQEFRMWCLDIPDFATVAHQMRPGAPTVSPFVRLVFSMLDPYLLRQADTRSARAMQNEAYELAVMHVANGGELPQVVPLIEADVDFERRMYDEKHFRVLQELANSG